MSNIWRLRSGTNLGTILERNKVNLPLPLANESINKDIRFKIISGQLPTGLFLENKFIVGVSIEVQRPTTSTFVIRAEEYQSNKRIKLEDRTYSITVEGFDTPEWRTPPGRLKLEDKQRLFVLDNTYIDFQLIAFDRDLSAGDQLEFFISEGKGLLPPGLMLYPDGKLKGIIAPTLALDVFDQQTFFDGSFYDRNPFDFGEPPNNGMDTFPYDAATFDFNTKVRTPKKLNRTYEFTVTVSDGEQLVDRTFQIYVVGDDFLRADNTVVKVGTGVFTADNTYLRAPVWLTPNNLGTKRASNYLTIFLDTFDANPESGPLVYRLERFNSDTSLSQLPPGLFLDESNGELFGFLPYQPAITKEYTFSITAVKYDATAVSRVEVAIRMFENANIGQTFLKIYPLISSDRTLVEFDTIRIANYSYQITSYEDRDPGTDQPYQNYAILRLSRPLFLDVPAEFIISKDYFVSNAAQTFTTATKEFYISIIGEVDSVIKYTTDKNLEPLRSNFSSQLAVNAVSSVPRAVVTYKVVSGSLPPGLELRSTGEIIGKVLQFGNTQTLGLTLLDTKTTTFDNARTTFDREYTVGILAEDQFKYSGLKKDFIIKVLDSDDRLYSSLYAKPYQRSDKRALWENFISDNSIFEIDKIYRPSDPAFGIQSDLKMLIYPGIETVEIPKLISSLEKNTKKKRFRLGEIKKALAKKPGSSTVVYEVVYIDIVDPYEKDNAGLPNAIKLPSKINAPITINQSPFDKIQGNPGSSANLEKQNRDEHRRQRLPLDHIKVSSDGLKISGKDLEYVYPMTITNVRNNLENIKVGNRNIEIENEYLPLWMKTSQNPLTAATGFIKAVPLCYCKPGEADFIIENIKNSEFDFTDIDYEVDRFIVDSTINNSEEQFLKFGNHRYNI